MPDHGADLFVPPRIVSGQNAAGINGKDGAPAESHGIVGGFKVFLNAENYEHKEGTPILLKCRSFTSMYGKFNFATSEIIIAPSPEEVRFCIN